MEFKVGDSVEVLTSVRPWMVGQIGKIVQINYDIIRCNFIDSPSLHILTPLQMGFLTLERYRSSFHRNRLKLLQTGSKEEQIINKIKELNNKFVRYQKTKGKDYAKVFLL